MSEILAMLRSLGEKVRGPMSNSPVPIRSQIAEEIDRIAALLAGGAPCDISESGYECIIRLLAKRCQILEKELEAARRRERGGL